MHQVDERTQKLNTIFDKGPSAILKLLGTAETLRFLGKIFGGDIEKKCTEHYARLLYGFSIDHPIMTGTLIKTMSEFLDPNFKGSGALAGATFGAVMVALQSYKETFLLKDVQQTFKRGRPVREPFEIYKKGNIFTPDCESFYEVTSKFGDPPSVLQVFEITDSGAKKYSSKKAMKIEKKEMLAFIITEKMVDVTECFYPGIPSVQW